jgi:AraC family transcriptional regulator of adaptative response/methylated-DNA-[protein]-cysteine methyltransferase
MLQEYLDSGSTAPALPLDLRGTPFQMRVWLTLMSIKIADKTTYGQLAQRLGAPRAARAVARACATNPIAVVVPCHRVVAQSGALSGYRWGVERKRALLQFEHRSLAALNLAQQRVHAL